jgi:hypothetical protein
MTHMRSIVLFSYVAVFVLAGVAEGYIHDVCFSRG